MLRMYALACFALVAWAMTAAAAGAYLKAWEPRDESEAAVRWDPERGNAYDQAVLKKLQAYLNADVPAGQRWPEAEVPVKRQMLYNQCYFNPISCFKRRK